jgi:hypothetical protein
MFTVGTIYKVTINSDTEEVSYHVECLDFGKIHGSITYLFKVLGTESEFISDEELNLISKAELENLIQLVFIADDPNLIPQKLLKYGVYFVPTNVDIEYQIEGDTISASVDGITMKYVKIQDRDDDDTSEDTSNDYENPMNYNFQPVSPTALHGSTETIDLNSTAYDAINMENITIIDYLNANKNNIVFKLKNTIILSNRRDLYTQSMRNLSNIVYECHNTDTALLPRPENLILTEPYFQINALPSVQGGLIKLSQLLSIINLKMRAIEISSEPIHTCSAVASYNTLHHGNAVSANHCQAGTQMDVHECYFIELPELTGGKYKIKNKTRNKIKKTRNKIKKTRKQNKKTRKQNKKTRKQNKRTRK